LERSCFFFVLIFDDDVDRVIWQELSGDRLELLRILVGALHQLFYLPVEEWPRFSD
jgi:hypothetical protein